jgi:SNF2-related domain
MARIEFNLSTLKSLTKSTKGALNEPLKKKTKTSNESLELDATFSLERSDEQYVACNLSLQCELAESISAPDVITSEELGSWENVDNDLNDTTSTLVLQTKSRRNLCTLFIDSEDLGQNLKRGYVRSETCILFTQQSIDVSSTFFWTADAVEAAKLFSTSTAFELRNPHSNRKDKLRYHLKGLIYLAQPDPCKQYQDLVPILPNDTPMGRLIIPGLQTQLKKYQDECVHWMLSCEHVSIDADGVRGVAPYRTAPFWTALDEGTFYNPCYNEATVDPQEILTTKPGGILADEMGLVTSTNEG